MFIHLFIPITRFLFLRTNMDTEYFEPEVMKRLNELYDSYGGNIDERRFIQFYFAAYEPYSMFGMPVVSYTWKAPRFNVQYSAN